MKPLDISTAKNPYLAASLIDMWRAAAAACKIAMQTGTGIVLSENGKAVRILAEQLRNQYPTESAL
jgi:hypothetical protein